MLEQKIPVPTSLGAKAPRGKLTSAAAHSESPFRTYGGGEGDMYGYSNALTTRHGLGRGLKFDTAKAVSSNVKDEKRSEGHDEASPKVRDDGRLELTVVAGFDATAYSWSSAKKWWVQSRDKVSSVWAKLITRCFLPCLPGGF